MNGNSDPQQARGNMRWDHVKNAVHEAPTDTLGGRLRWKEYLIYRFRLAAPLDPPIPFLF